MSETIEQHIRDILISLGENPNRVGLQNTPARFRKALEYLTKGYHEKVEDITKGAVFESTMDEMVIVKNIELYSLCEHHLLPFFGKCHIAYLPNGKVIGLSKIARIVEMYA